MTETSNSMSHDTMERRALDLVVQLTKWVLYCELTGYAPSDPGLIPETRELLRRPVPPDETPDVPTGPIAGHAEHRFMLWLMKEIPPGTVISSPTWWSPRIFKAAQRAMEIQREVRPEEAPAPQSCTCGHDGPRGPKHPPRVPGHNPVA